MYVFTHPAKMMWYSFLKGLMIGFGSVLGATIIVGIFLFLVAQISVIPVVGSFVESVIQEVQSINGQQLQSPVTNPGALMQGSSMMDQYNKAKNALKNSENDLFNSI